MDTNSFMMNSNVSGLIAVGLGPVVWWFLVGFVDLGP